MIAATLPPVPPDAVIVSVRKTMRHTRTTYRPLEHYQTTEADLVGSIICTPTGRIIIGNVPTATLAQADAMVSDSLVVTIDGVSVAYSGTCETTNVFIPALGNVVIGYRWDARWVSEEIKPVGATFVPWDVDRMTLPSIPYYGDPVTVTRHRKHHH